jgi:histidyl-tRNA synthetase
MLAFGAQSSQFEIKINSRKVMNELFTDILKLDTNSIYKLSKLIDKKKKITKEEFIQQAKELVTTNYEVFEGYMTATSISEIPQSLLDSRNVKELKTVLETLYTMSAQSCVFDPTIMRGLDYYTGIVFEVFDTGPENNRSLFGGGRYDNLLDMFGVDSVSAVGFGMGDVPLQDFLETYKLLPKLSSEIDVVLCTLDEQVAAASFELADRLRKSSNSKQLKVLVDFSDKKVGQKITNAQKAGAKYVICIGEEEVKTENYTLKKLDDFSEEKLSEQELANLLSLS